MLFDNNASDLDFMRNMAELFRFIALLVKVELRL